MTITYDDIDGLVAQIRDRKPNAMTVSSVTTNLHARSVLLAIQASHFSELLFPEGQETGIEGSDYYPLLGPWANANLSSVYLRGWAWDWAEEPGYSSSGQRQLDLVLVNQESEDIIQEIFTLYALWSGYMSLSRTIESLEYAETGYEGHHQQHLDPITDDALDDYVRIFALCLERAEWPNGEA